MIHTTKIEIFFPSMSIVYNAVLSTNRTTTVDSYSRTHMFGHTSLRSMNNVDTNCTGNGALDDSSEKEQILFKNPFFSQSFLGGTCVNGNSSIQDPQTMSLEATKASLFLAGTAVFDWTKPTNIIAQRVPHQPSLSHAPSASTSCALSRWIAMQTANMPSARSTAFASAMNDPPSTSTPILPVQFSSQQEDSVTLPLATSSLHNIQNSVYQLGGYVNNGASMLTMPEFLLESDRQQQHSSLDIDPCMAASNGTHLVSVNDLDSSCTRGQVSAGSTSARFRRDQAEQWSERYDELVLFWKAEGHCRVPRNHKKFGELYVLFKAN
jgi:hypothetical protein